MEIKRTRTILTPDPKKVLLRSFAPATEIQHKNIISRILALSDDEVENEIKAIYEEFGSRHRDITEFFLKRYTQSNDSLNNVPQTSKSRQLLIGASLSMEYAVESTALFNPAMVWHPDKSTVNSGNKRFILSLRATGEGHISSIVFREGIVDPMNNIIVEKPGSFVTSPGRVINTVFDKSFLRRKIIEENLDYEFSNKIFLQLNDKFTLNEMEAVLEKTVSEYEPGREKYNKLSDALLSMCSTVYEVIYDKEIPLSERIIFPRSPAESNGVEDARFVKFTDENGSEQYYATYTAYNGVKIQSQLLETKDFLHFRVSKLFGSEVRNKGMALFPRKINGQYAMLARQDNENNYIMFSDNIYLWENKRLLSKPAFNWEIVQSGNCGSPIETEKGWLVLTHGVGPVRKYCIGVMLLDIDDPSKVIGRLRYPLLSPDETEREGYVPNVVYSCGSVINGNTLILPYAMSDYSSSFACVDMQELLGELTN